MTNYKQDHKQNAYDALNTAYSNANDPHEAACGNAAAIVEATLYLAEQQRIANDMAFIRFALSEQSTVTDEDGLQKVADRVVEGLGL